MPPFHSGARTYPFVAGVYDLSKIMVCEHPVRQVPSGTRNTRMSEAGNRARYAARLLHTPWICSFKPFATSRMAN